jgi:phospholipid transport system substrate-binding protein
MSRTAVMGTCLVLWSLAGPAAAGIPTDHLRGATDRVLKILQDPDFKGPEKAEARRKAIRSVADEVFDWQETGKRALARHWQPLSPEQRTEFATLFADLVERSYLAKIEAFSGERIVYAGDHVDGDQATVRTKLVTKANTEVPLEYRMTRQGERWRVHDVVIEGVSLVATYRSQFNRIITQSSYEELTKRLRSKQQEVLFETQGAPGGAKP